MIWTYGFALGCLVVMLAVYRSYRELRDEITRLPRAGHSNGLPHALLGVSLQAAIELPEHVKGVAAVVQFAAPTCPQCREEMKVLEKAYKNKPFPYVCLYEVEANEQAVQQFVAEFGHMQLQPIAPETVQALGVAFTPLVIMIDADTVVSLVEFRLPKILASMQSAERRAG